MHPLSQRLSRPAATPEQRELLWASLADCPRWGATGVVLTSADRQRLLRSATHLWPDLLPDQAALTLRGYLSSVVYGQDVAILYDCQRSPLVSAWASAAQAGGA